MLDKDTDPWEKKKTKQKTAETFITAHDLSIKDFIYTSVNKNAPFSDLRVAFVLQELRNPVFFLYVFRVVAIKHGKFKTSFEKIQ